VPGEFSFSLSVAAADLSWNRLRLGQPPQVLDVPSVGANVSDQARLWEVVSRDLTSRGLMRGGRLDAEIEEALTLVARFGWAIDGVVMSADGDDNQVFRAVAHDRLGVLVRRQLQDQMIRFDVLRPEAVLPAVVGLIGDLKPGTGKSITYPDPDAAPPVKPAQSRHARSDDDEQEMGSVMRPAWPEGGNYEAQRRSAMAILAKPRTRGGWFSVITRDRNGRENRPSHVNWLDTFDGRYLAYSRPGPDGQPWMTCTPADTGRIFHTLNTALQSPG
jgi:hypothetical protein